MDLFKFFSSKPSPKEVAKGRLKLILINDWADLSPELLTKIKSEILNVILKYVEVDSGDIDVRLTKMDAEDGNSPALIANIPIRRIR